MYRTDVDVLTRLHPKGVNSSIRLALKNEVHIELMAWRYLNHLSHCFPGISEVQIKSVQNAKLNQSSDDSETLEDAPVQGCKSPGLETVWMPKVHNVDCTV